MENTVIIAPLPVERKTVTAALSAVARVDRRKAVDQPAVHGALRDLVGGAPLGAVRHRGDAITVVQRANAVAQHTTRLT